MNTLSRIALIMLLLGLTLFPAAALAAPANTITVDGSTCTLADAITAANTDTATGGCPAGSGADTINLTVNVTLTSALPQITSEITIQGNNHIIDGNSAHRIFDISSDGDLTLDDLTIQNGKFQGNGGGIACTGTLMVTNSTISNNSASYDGGGIYNYQGTVTVNNSTISGNSAQDGNGGGIFNYQGTIIVENKSIISDNSVQDLIGGFYNGGYGGGIYNVGGMVTITNSTIKNNEADSYSGGGIYNYQGTVTVTGSTISNNSAPYDNGGGIFSFEGDVTVTSSTISGNSAKHDGGGIYNHQGTITVENNSIISDNSAQDGNGGGIYNYSYDDNSQSTVTVTDSTISNNTADDDGGGVYNYSYDANSQTIVTLTNSTISGNSATNGIGGGVYIENGAVTITNSTISNNSAEQRCGGLHNYSYGANSTVTVKNSTIYDNSAQYATGSNIDNYQGTDTATVTVANSIVARQSSGSGCFGSITSNGYNIESGASCGFTATGDLQNTDPKLNALSNDVHVPQNDSPAIDAGNPAAPGSGGAACEAADQRGEARNDLRCDIGAVEVKLSDTDTVIKAVNGAGTYTFGPTLAKIVVTTQGSLDKLTVQYHSGDHPHATRMNGQWWGITPEGSGYTANLDLPHTVNPDANAKVCRWTGTGSVWDCARDGSTATRVWRNGVTSFSDWAVGDNVGPNVISLTTMTANSGSSPLSIVGLFLGLLIAGAGLYKVSRPSV